MDEDFRKHLDLIQGVVNRLAGNSFSVKTWAVGLITVLGGLAAKDADARLSCALLLPALCFWGLDAYYLRQERLFRKLYEKTVTGDAKAPRYSLNPSPYAKEVDGIGRVAFSPTVRWLHLPILLFVIGLIVYSVGGWGHALAAAGAGLPGCRGLVTK
jgi:hypothetical protein